MLLFQDLVELEVASVERVYSFAATSRLVGCNLSFALLNLVQCFFECVGA